MIVKVATWVGPKEIKYRWWSPISPTQKRSETKLGQKTVPTYRLERERRRLRR